MPFQPARRNQERPLIGSLMMCLSVVLLLVGMLAGIVMGIQQNVALGPAHAHLDLVGGAPLLLFGPVLQTGSSCGDHDPCQGAGLAPHDRRDPAVAPPAPRPPQSLFELIRGIVRETDSRRSQAHATHENIWTNR
jgi:hypothetical protein